MLIKTVNGNRGSGVKARTARLAGAEWGSGVPT